MYEGLSESSRKSIVMTGHLCARDERRPSTRLSIVSFSELKRGVVGLTSAQHVELNFFELVEIIFFRELSESPSYNRTSCTLYTLVHKSTLNSLSK